MTPPAAPPEDLALDACAALQADLAAQEPGAPPPSSADPAGPWLLLITTLERAAQLAPARRAAHFRRARAVWDDAAAVLDEPRYAAAGARLARWRTPDPTLPLVKELLWAVEQPEAAGLTRLALAGYGAIARMLPVTDVRRGYVSAQSARALRSMGTLDAAREHYAFGERLGVQFGDRWLRVRSALGVGAAHQQAGNLPAARVVFRRILEDGSPDPRFTAAAHHGLVLAAIAAEDWDSALEHGWHLLQAGRRGAAPRADVLLMMAAVCRRIGRHRAALSAAAASLPHGRVVDDPVVARRIMTEVALDTNDRALGLENAAALRDLLRTGVGPYERARALLALALAEERWGRRHRAASAIDRALELARAHRFHELAYKMEIVSDRLAASSEAAARAASTAAPFEDAASAPVALTPKSNRIVHRLQLLETSRAAVAATG